MFPWSLLIWNSSSIFPCLSQQLTSHTTWASYFSKRPSLGFLWCLLVMTQHVSSWQWHISEAVNISRTHSETLMGSSCFEGDGHHSVHHVAEVISGVSIVRSLFFLCNKWFVGKFLERMYISCYSSGCPPARWSIHWWFWRESIFALMITKCGFANSIIPSRWNSTFYYQKNKTNSFPFSPST